MDRELKKMMLQMIGETLEMEKAGGPFFDQLVELKKKFEKAQRSRESKETNVSVSWDDEDKSNKAVDGDWTMNGNNRNGDHNVTVHSVDSPAQPVMSRTPLNWEEPDISINWDDEGESDAEINPAADAAQEDRDWTIIENNKNGGNMDKNHSFYSFVSTAQSVVSRTSAADFDAKKAFLDDTIQASTVQKIRPFVLPSVYSLIVSEPAKFKDPIVVSADTNPLRIVSTAKNKLLPTYNGCVLFGDNLFLHMALTTMGFYLNFAYVRPISGMCMSGLSIRMAVRELRKKNFAEGTILVANLGTTDLLLGRDLIHMIEEYYKLLQLCDSKQYILISTTMAPIADSKYNHDHFKRFNAFLKKMPYCIDLFSNMVGEDKLLKRKYYEDAPSKVDGAAGPITLWSGKGHYHVLTTIEKNLLYYSNGY